ncbi:MAG TPA: DUF4139 domain-containing protein [Polyangiaceae bacterium]|nr:DUF4139 domain-containing protein [Polyangiaceae bacterium]
MRKVLLSMSALALVGCGGATSYVHTDTTLGRVVIYRNGVAYFERTAHVDDDKLTLAVPADKVDDFLKSLTVVDAKTGEPTPVSYPTDPGATETGTGLIDMKIELPGKRPHDLRLSYVTEAPAWKPSYRVVLGDDKKVDMVGWAIVDNTSGEDWKNVKLGVGASSALSFRFDLRSVRLVERETLQSNDMFAQAPPTGQATYGGPEVVVAKKVLGDVSDESIRKEDTEKDVDGAVAFSDDPLATAMANQSSAQGAPSAPRPAPSTTAGGRRGPPPPPAKPKAAADPLAGLAQRLKNETGTITIEGYAGPGDADKQVASLDRANRLRDQLVQHGVDASKLVAVGKGAQPGRNGGARVLEAEGQVAATGGAAGAPAGGQGTQQQPVSLDPIGTSHFESGQAMSVTRGTSAMISILHTPTEGEVVYLYDPESARGNAQFAFRSLRLRNPTDSQLESGPVTVFGDGRFIGEGMSEPIPAHQVAFVPFALDRQVVVDRVGGERDEIARIISVNRGVFSTQVQHIKRTTLVVHNRLPNKVVMYVRHTVTPGYHASKAPTDPEHVSGADLYRVEVDGFGKQEVILEESTPVYRTADLRTPDGMGLVRAYLTSAVINGPLKGQIEELVRVQKDIADDEQRRDTLREQMGEYRQRMDELHAQIFTLRAVRTAGPLMVNLEKKLQEVSDKLSKSTIDVVALEEKLMLARIKFQDGVADLSLEADGKVAAAR